MERFKRQTAALQACDALKQWATALCAGRKPTGSVHPDIIKSSGSDMGGFALAVGLRVAVELTSRGKLTLREPHPHKVTTGGIQGAATMFVICPYDVPEDTFNNITSDTRGYYFCPLSGELKPLRMEK